jgi:putative PIN family toxin of toxin-antitoxin system
MLIVLDTNVLISGLLNPHGPQGRILDMLLDGRLHLLYDDRILAEYRDVLARPKLEISEDLANAVIRYLRLSGNHVTASPLPVKTVSDPDDLPFVEVTISGEAEFLVTGNQRHYSGLEDIGIVVLTPTGLIEALLK